MKILFNEKTAHEDRMSVKGLTLKEEERVIELLNDALNFHEENDIKVVQRFVSNYENLSHFAAINSNQWLKYSK